jgi:hypothetical protein
MNLRTTPSSGTSLGGVTAVMRSVGGLAARTLLPLNSRRWLRRHLMGSPFGVVGGRRLSPSSPLLGLQGRPVDRYYIESFLSRHASDVRGRVLEVGDDSYTRKFGGDRVTRSDVLHVTPGASGATIIADLTQHDGLAPESFDCIILTQTLQMIYDVRAAIATVYRSLSRGGVALVTMPVITPISRYDMERWGDYWRVTSPAARRLFAEAAADAEVTVQPYGNLVAAIAYLRGFAAEDLSAEECDARDDDYEVLIGIRMRKVR